MGTTSSSDDGEEVIDRRARQAYRDRICELQADLEEAELRNDSGAAERVRQELDPLLDHLAKAVGLGGRGRKLGATSERARSAVTWRIRSAIRKIESAHPQLGKHLSNAIRTGVFCSYSPETPVLWNL